MFAGSLVMGVTVLCFAAWLHWNDTQGWPNESFNSELDHQYRRRRSRSRKRIHMIIAACGILIMSPHSRVRGRFGSPPGCP